LVFRKRVGEAMVKRHDLHDDYPEWGDGSSAGRDIRLEELEMERRVSDYLRELPFLWVDVDDEPGPRSDRAYLERNAIALVSNYRKAPIDPRSNRWLGTNSPSQKIRESGLWNVTTSTSPTTRPFSTNWPRPSRRPNHCSRAHRFLPISNLVPERN
jgi:hypothetical protein